MYVFTVVQLNGQVRIYFRPSSIYSYFVVQIFFQMRRKGCPILFHYILSICEYIEIFGGKKRLTEKKKHKNKQILFNEL